MTHGTPGPYLVMGVSGCGKSTIASLLAASLNALFLDADDFHPEANKEKMASGNPLTDEDRWPWLVLLNQTLRTHHMAGQPVVLACSALRQTYRDILVRDLDEAVFIYLAGTKQEIQSRLEARSGHFMPPTLLDSQFATLEEPSNAIRVPISHSPGQIVDEIMSQLFSHVRPAEDCERCH